MFQEVGFSSFSLNKQRRPSMIIVVITYDAYRRHSSRLSDTPASTQPRWAGLVETPRCSGQGCPPQGCCRAPPHPGSCSLSSWPINVTSQVFDSVTHSVHSKTSSQEENRKHVSEKGKLGTKKIVSLFKLRLLATVSFRASMTKFSNLGSTTAPVGSKIGEEGTLGFFLAGLSAILNSNNTWPLATYQCKVH